MPHYGHTLGDDERNWEPLEMHLEAVAGLAEKFADAFHAGEWGRLAGLWHDIGKYSPAFQNYLRRENGLEAHLEGLPGRVDHSTAGARHAAERFGGLGRILAYAIAGHHAGLPDGEPLGQSGTLVARLEKKIEPYCDAPRPLLEKPCPARPRLSFDSQDPGRAAFQVAFFIRMLFSALVDADFLATEAFVNQQQSALRPTCQTTIPRLEETLRNYLERLAENAPPSEVNENRRQILTACRSAAELSPGLFSLTVPTGGGKTLASLAFALRHATLHGLDRVVFAIPFTSIIEQTADVYRRVFAPLGDDIVLEHHSNLDPKRETPSSRLASENWDAPIVVTTNVQLFESLFANRTSRCRKLHRLAGSVLILDEAQTLPVELLQPCLAALRELAADYRCSIVLCTATQPAITAQPNFPIGLKDVREIIHDPTGLYRRMKRVRAEHLGVLPDQDLVARLSDHAQFLCIVNTRPHAARVFAQLQEVADKERESLFHLSTFMCGEHRSDVLATIRRRLADGLPCRVVSTQLIEAGVDVDFPIVYRAMAGLDSVAQAAGRCNREGRLAEGGKVYLFRPEGRLPRGLLGAMARTTEELLALGEFEDILGLDAVRRYFELHYWKQQAKWDKHEIMAQFPLPPDRLIFQFRTAAEQFRFIEDHSRPVIVPYGEEGAELIEAVRGPAWPDRALRRRLQRFLVPIPQEAYLAMRGSDLEDHHEEAFTVLLNVDLYDKRLGLRLELAGQHDVESLIV